MALSPPQAASHCFGFERDFVGSWRCIPLCVRRKLDLIGLKLQLSHWLDLSQAERQRLVDWADDAGALEALAEHLRTTTRRLRAGEAGSLPPAREESWQNPAAVPPEVSAAASERGRRLGAGEWRGLSELERFALCKLVRPGHDHHNLPAALAEMLPGA